jgi:predicted secreted hydrolase
MYYQLRRQDGSVDSCSHGTWIESDGSSHGVRFVQLEVSSFWQDEAGHRYPAKWLIRLPQQSCELVVQPKMKDQLLRTSIPYWEGAVRISGTRKGVPVTGQGYVELTGYTGTVTAIPEW